GRPPGLTLFPTRRSSDLGMAGVGLFFTGVGAVAAQVAGTARRAIGIASGAVLVAFLVRGYGAVEESWWTWASPFGWQDELRPFRSEEHTSELQSRENLVC